MTESQKTESSKPEAANAEAANAEVANAEVSNAEPIKPATAKPEPKKRVPKPAVYALSRQSRCYQCDKKLAAGEIVRLKDAEDEREVQCQKCAGLTHLEVLMSGHAQITRLATKYSKEQFTIKRWSELWKCYERQGVLVEPQAIDRAEKETGSKLPNRVGVTKE